MSLDGDIPVAVVSGRVDIDLAISIWVSGYRAHGVSQVDAVLDLTRDGGLVLLDARSPTCDDWLEQLRTEGYSGPVVLLDHQITTGVSIDEAAVRSPWTLDGVREAFELARTLASSRVADRVAGASDDLFTAKRPRRSSATPALADADASSSSEERPRRLRPLL